MTTKNSILRSKSERNLNDERHNNGALTYERLQNYNNFTTTIETNATTSSINCIRLFNDNETNGNNEVLNHRTQSRADIVSRPTTIPSSLLENSMTELVMEDDLRNENEPTSAILDYCKRKFLRPYVIILSLVGLNPISTEASRLRTFVSYGVSFLVLILLLCGYFLQYLCLYRNEQEFFNTSIIMPTIQRQRQTPEMHIAQQQQQQLQQQQQKQMAALLENSINNNDNNVIAHLFSLEFFFNFLLPYILHLFGFISAIFVYKYFDHEQLQNLVERVFLTSIKPRQLCLGLWLHVTFTGCLCMIMFGISIPVVMLQNPIMKNDWLTDDELNEWQLTIKFVLLFFIFIHQFVEVIVLNCYWIECYLLRNYLSTLSYKLLVHSIESLEWMREVLEFHKLLTYLNERIAIPICAYIILKLSYALIGLIYLFKYFDMESLSVIESISRITNVALWLILGLLPFLMAASVNAVCQMARAAGHQIRVRPFVYHNTTLDELNSILLFASTLNMSAKLFRIPIQPNYLFFVLFVFFIGLLVVGMLQNINM